MGHEKFDQHSQGQYWETYFKNDKEFYAAIQHHVLRHIPKENTIGIDIGAGPGIGARIFADLGFKTKLTGIEPSGTFVDGVKLSEEFVKSRSSVEYTSVRGGITEIKTPEIDSLGYILILRASHEISESIKGKHNFFKELSRIVVGLKKQGFLIIAEPQYSDDDTSEEIIQKVQQYQMKNIGHCHVPSDYITASEMKMKIQDIGLRLIDETIIPNDRLLKYLQSEGLNLDKSPCSFYIQTFQK